MDEHGQIINDAIKQKVMESMRRRWSAAEDQIRIFLKMGYRMDELAIVSRDWDSPLEVMPIEKV